MEYVNLITYFVSLFHETTKWMKKRMQNTVLWVYKKLQQTDYKAMKINDLVQVLNQIYIWR